MRVVYKLPVKDGVLISISDQEKEIALDNIGAKLEMDKETHLVFVTIIFSGISIHQLQINKTGRIIPKFSDLEEQVFGISSYIANRILIQTAVDVLNLQQGICVTPHISPETPTGEKFLAMHGIAFDVSGLISCHIVRDKFLKPDDFEMGFNFSKAFANYAEGLRVLSPLLRYDLTYKVLEHFCDKIGEKFDKQISSYVIKYDQRFNQLQVKSLRIIRNRIMHPNRKDHLNPSDMASIHEVEAALPLLSDITKILLQTLPEKNCEEI